MLFRSAKKIEAGILSRGRDARELTRAMRMPAGTAILNVISLVDKLSRSVWAEPEDAAISRFVLAESVEGPAIAKALNELGKQKTELRHSKGSHELTRLSYLIMRYRATLWPVPDGPRPDDQFVDMRTNKRATEETREQVLRDAVEALKAAVVADAKVPASEVDVAPTGTYAPGGLVRIRQQVLVPSP